MEILDSNSYNATTGRSQVTAISLDILSVPPFFETLHLAQLTHLHYFTDPCGHNFTTMDLEHSPFNSPVLGFFHLTTSSGQVTLIWLSVRF